MISGLCLMVLYFLEVEMAGNNENNVNPEEIWKDLSDA